MRYTAQPNLVLETLLYLGLRAANVNQQFLEDRLCKMGCSDLSDFRRQYAPFNALQTRLDDSVRLPEELLPALFSDLAGFPGNTAGFYSIALLLFAPAASQHCGDLDSFLAHMQQQTPQDVARDLLISLDCIHLLTPGKDSIQVLKKVLPTLPMTKQSRKLLQDARRNYSETLDQVARCLRPTYDVFCTVSGEMAHLAHAHGAELSSPEVERYLRETSVFQLHPDTEYEIRPLLIDPSSNLFFDMLTPDSSHVIYCGLLQEFMREQQRAASSSRQHIFECLHLLGDQTRFDILCYLSRHPAYGQELSTHFGLARNTIHHHMSKLFDIGLVRCMVKGARVYYSVDKNHFRQLTEQLCSLMTDAPSESDLSDTP